jgi:hypothetical protein
MPLLKPSGMVAAAGLAGSLLIGLALGRTSVERCPRSAHPPVRRSAVPTAPQRTPKPLSLPGPELLPPPPPLELAPASVGPAPSAPSPWRWSRADAQLPSQASRALELALAWLPRESGSAPAPLLQSPEALEIRRRQLWLTSDQALQLQRLWDSGRTALWRQAPLPAGSASRQVQPLALAALGLDGPHGFSLVDGRDLLLIWRSEGHWWLLRTPWTASPASRSQPLTTP